MTSSPTKLYDETASFKLTNGTGPVHPRSDVGFVEGGEFTCHPPFSDYGFIDNHPPGPSRSFYVVGVTAHPTRQLGSVCRARGKSRASYRSRLGDLLGVPIVLPDRSVLVAISGGTVWGSDNGFLRLDDHLQAHDTFGGTVFLLDADVVDAQFDKNVDALDIGNRLAAVHRALEQVTGIDAR